MLFMLAMDICVLFCVIKSAQILYLMAIHVTVHLTLLFI